MKIIEDVTSVIGENFDCLFSCEVKPVEKPLDWFYDEERQQFYQWETYSCEETNGRCYDYFKLGPWLTGRPACLNPKPC